MKHRSRARPTRVLSRVAIGVLISAAAIGALAAVTGADDAAVPSGSTTTADTSEVVEQPPAETDSARPPDTTEATSPSATAVITTTLPEPEPPPVSPPYLPADSESERDAKRLGAEVVHRLTNYDADMSLDDVVAAIVDRPEQLVVLAEAAAPLHHPGRWSRGTIEYAQLGGLSHDGTSIMVVVRQSVGIGEDIEVVQTRTIDVRLTRPEGNWRFDRLAHAGGDPVARPATLSPEATAVVDDPRIVLADSALWDIYRGHTSTALLRLMAELADRTPYAAVVLSNGHPYNVFATNRVSNHSVGRAVDVYLLGGTRVIDAHESGSEAHQLVSWLLDRTDVRSIGSPWALDGYGGRSFTDTVHHDHIHISVH